MSDLPPVVEAAERFRLALIRNERAAATRLVRAYGLAYQRLQGDINALLQVISEMPEPTWAQVQRLSLYRSLLDQIEVEIGRFAIIAENDIGEGARAAIALALADSERLVQLALPGLNAAEVKAIWNRMVPEQVETLIGFLQPDSPLYVNLQRLGPDVAALVVGKLSMGIILGYNPRKIAREIANATGQGLTWSLNTARTANLWAYREASRANYIANSHVVKGWIWFAQLGDKRTCMSCVAMHGSVHSLDEPLNDHHAGRCTMLPETVSYRDLGIDVPDDLPAIQKGEEWFRGLSAAQQRALMGPSVYAAWRANEFQFGQLSQPYENDVYGQMLREASLRGLIGERAKNYYAR